MARTILQRAGTVPVECPTLIGYEPETRALDGRRDENAVMLATVIEDNAARRVGTAIVLYPDGRLAAWVQTNHFWNAPTSL